MQNEGKRLCQRTTGQIRFTQKSRSNYPDEFVKIAEILLNSTVLRRIKHTALSFYNFICAESAKSDGAVKLPKLVCFFFGTFFLQIKKKVNLNNHLSL